MAIKSVSIRIEKEMLDKLAFIADYEGRSVRFYSNYRNGLGKARESLAATR